MEYEFQEGEAKHAVAVERSGNGFRVTVDGREMEVDLVAVEPGCYSLVMGGEATDVVVVRDGSRRYVVVGGCSVVLDEGGGEARVGATALEEVIAGVQTIRAPMPGKVVKIAAAEGDAVDKGQIVVVEAMKMEHPLSAAGPGVVKKIYCEEGQNVDADQPLAEVEVEGNG
jgi:acetyl/propionyl-CoA carboxylase alpha subunit